MKDYRKLKRYWRLVLKSSTILNFQDYHYQSLFKKPMPETDIIDYLLNLDSTLKATSLKTLKKHLPRIQNTFNSSFSNGPLEGTINKIKNIKRITYGYRSFWNFKHRILTCFNLIPKSNLIISDKVA